MHFVQHHMSHAGKQRVCRQTPQQHAGRAEETLCGVGRDLVQAHGVPDGLPHLLAALVGDTLCQGHSRDAARLGNQDVG